MNSSDIVGSKYPSPTAFIGTANVSGGISYTATFQVELILTMSQSSATGSVTVNSAVIQMPVGVPFSMRMALSAGQTLTVSATSSNGYVSISAIKAQ